MSIKFNEKTYILDGAMGTMLQNAGARSGETTTEFGFRHPEILKDIHRQYIEAGADIICANTFGINKYKINDRSVKEAIDMSIKPAVEAREEAREKHGAEVMVALDVGPLGELLEPMGKLTFEAAYEAFKEVMIAGDVAGADMVAIETMTDIYEMKAAVLAAKENTSLPVSASMTFEENGRTFTGVSIEAMALILEGLGVEAMGINCSLGPIEIFPMARELRSLTDLPLWIKPNAGLPNPQTGEYGITCEQFVDKMKEYIAIGIDMVGGCCGTTPEYISMLAADRNAKGKKLCGLTSNAKNNTAEPLHEEAKRAPHPLRICSGNTVVAVDHVTVIGERINPTGKKKLKQALLEGDHDYILTQAVEQIDAGAEVLDVNVGVPSLDDVGVLPMIVKKLQSITGMPLQIDSSNPEAIEAALRVYNGKAIVNSVNGEEAVMRAVLPVVKKYGAAVIGLTLDENGIPKTAEGRLAIAERIMSRAAEYGIPKEDVIIDCLTLTVSAQQKEANETLKAVRLVKERLGLSTALGVSNISFGLPLRSVINRTFLSMAMECGLDLPIINPNDEDMMASVFAYNVLKNKDENAAKYIERYGDTELEAAKISQKKDKNHGKSSPEDTPEQDIFYSIEKGMKSDTASAVKLLLEDHDEMDVVNGSLIPALDKIGQGFENGSIFLPQMLQAAMAAQAGFDVIKESMAKNDREAVSLGQVVIATVKGDIHDIGKNIVKVIMENYGYQMIDLGRDVDVERIVQTVREHDIKLLGLSALMTTTLKSMEETITAVRAISPDCRIMVGGAVLTADYAEQIGADYYCKDAMKSVEAAQEVFNEQI